MKGPVLQTVSMSPVRPTVDFPDPTSGSRSAAVFAWLGADCPFGLALPNATPTASQMYAPRGVWIDDDRLIVCDSGNHRVLIYHTVPTTDHADADVVLGQSDFTREGKGYGVGDPTRGLFLPTGVIVVDGRLLVADAWHHRVLVWNEIPDRSATPPDFAIGQAGLDRATENRGRGHADRDSLYWPYGIAWDGTRLWIADTGNRRVVGYDGFPEPGAMADILIGQPTWQSSEENRGGEVAADSFRWPHDIAIACGQTACGGLLIADAGNHRVLGWDKTPVQHEVIEDACDRLLGQNDPHTAREWPYEPPGPSRLRFPYAVDIDDDIAAVADTANNRVLFWRLPITSETFAAASDVIGQLDFSGNGENRWEQVGRETLSWPYGLSLHRGRLAVTDSGNNRVMLWDVQDIVANKNVLDEAKECY
ncbi:MAG: NHL repeat-containing protein [Planctomycetota bacterium]